MKKLAIKLFLSLSIFSLTATTSFAHTIRYIDHYYRNDDYYDKYNHVHDLYYDYDKYGRQYYDNSYNYVKYDRYDNKYYDSYEYGSRSYYDYDKRYMKKDFNYGDLNVFNKRQNNFNVNLVLDPSFDYIVQPFAFDFFFHDDFFINSFFPSSIGFPVVTRTQFFQPFFVTAGTFF